MTETHQAGGTPGQPEPGMTSEQPKAGMTQGRKLGLVAGAIVVAFLIGFGWQFFVAQGLERELAETRRELAFRSLEARLGGAAVSAYSGAYELGRTQASQFFTGLQQRIEDAPASAQPALRDIIAQRDTVITLLSRASPESAGMLAELYGAYIGAVGTEGVRPE